MPKWKCDPVLVMAAVMLCVSVCLRSIFFCYFFLQFSLETCSYISNIHVCLMAETDRDRKDGIGLETVPCGMNRDTLGVVSVPIHNVLFINIRLWFKVITTIKTRKILFYFLWLFIRRFYFGFDSGCAYICHTVCSSFLRSFSLFFFCYQRVSACVRVCISVFSKL